MAKKKTLNLSELKNYTIKDDLSENKQEYGFGSWLGSNAGNILKTAGGVGAMMVPGGQLAGASLIAGGVGGMAANAVDDPVASAAIQEGANVGGLVAGLHAAQMANGGPMNYNNGGMVNNNGLTEYNGGGTHEENPRGGIDVGPNAQVEANETRWEDYIFSDRLKVPGSKSKATFADMSKKIKDKYSQRKNDSFDKKAMEREMKALMAMQESERERRDIRYKQTMDELSAYGGKIKHADGGDVYNINNPEMLDAKGAFSNVHALDNTGERHIYDEATRAAVSKDPYAFTSPSNFLLDPNYTPAQNSADIKKTLADNINGVSTVTDMSDQFAKSNQNARNITPGTQTENVYQLEPRMTDLRKQYAYLGEDYKPSIDPTGTRVLGDDVASQRKRVLDDKINKYRINFAKMLGVPTNPQGLPDFTQLDPNVSFDKSKIPADKLKNFYDMLYEKQAIRDAQGFRRKQYYGDKEAEQMGYTADTPLEDLNFGIRFLTGAQNPQIYSQKAYGGKVQYGGGSGLDLNLNAFNAANNAINPNIGPLAAGAGPMGTLSDQVMDLNKYYDPNSIPMQDNTDYVDAPNPGNTSYSSTGMGMGLNPAALKAATDAANLENQSAVGGTSDVPGKFGIKDAAVLGLQNMGNLYNLFQGMQGPEDVQFDRINPTKVDYSKSIADARRAYEQAGSIARRNIGKTATSSGQALSALIAQEAALDRNKGQAIRSAMEGQENTNAQITNQAESQNAQISMQEQIAGEQNKAASDMSTQLGLTGIGSSIAGFNRDRLAYNAQDRAMYEYMKTNNYSWGTDPETGKPTMISNITGKPVNRV